MVCALHYLWFVVEATRLGEEQLLEWFAPGVVQNAGVSDEHFAIASLVIILI
jgi:hypothetical protein